MVKIGGPASMCRHCIFHVGATLGLPTRHSVFLGYGTVGFHHN